MRLVCPECAAQYEVDSNAIPEAGRDVQCASCGNTWFQKRVTGLRKVQPAPEPEPAPEPAPEPEYEDDTGDQQRDHTPQWDADDAEDEDAEPDPRRPARPQAAATDPSVLDILRREAEHDAAVRRGEIAPAPEPDFDPPAPEDTPADLTEEGPPADPYAIQPQVSAAAGRGRRLHLSPGAEDSQDDGAPEPDAPIAPKRPERPARPERPTGPRPGRPDVEALKSSIRTAIETEDADQADDFHQPEVRTRSGGGRFGYYLAIMLGLVLIAVYALKPQIVTALPAAAPILDQYTALVDIARRNLADQIDRLVLMIKGLMQG